MLLVRLVCGEIGYPAVRTQQMAIQRVEELLHIDPPEACGPVRSVLLFVVFIFIVQSLSTVRHTTAVHACPCTHPAIRKIPMQTLARVEAIWLVQSTCRSKRSRRRWSALPGSSR
jgi:hypothetical protein